MRWDCVHYQDQVWYKPNLRGRTVKDALWCECSVSALSVSDTRLKMCKAATCGNTGRVWGPEGHGKDPRGNERSEKRCHEEKKDRKEKSRPFGNHNRGLQVQPEATQSMCRIGDIPRPTALWLPMFLSWCLSPQGNKGSSHSAWSPYKGHASAPATAPPAISAGKRVFQVNC